MHNRPATPKRPGIHAPLAIFGSALALRLLHLHFFRSTIFFDQPIFDEVFYHERALAIAAGNWLGHTVPFMGPLYSYFLGLIYSVSGGSRLIALALQAALGAGTCALTYLVARDLFKQRVALVAGIITVFYGVLIFYDGLLLMETLTLFLNMLCLLSLMRGIRDGKGVYLVVAGLCLGLSALGRSSVLVFGLGALLLILLGSPRPGRQRMGAAVLFLTSMLVVIMPVTIRNHALEGELTLVSANGGLNFYVGNGPGANGTFRILTDTGVAPGDMTGRFEAEIVAGRRLTLAETSRWWYGRTFDYVRAHPWAFVRNLAWKARLFWNSYEIPQIEWYDATRSYSPVLGLPLVPSSLVIPFALLGIVVAAKRFRRAPCLVVYIAAQTLVFSLFFVTSRYRMSVLPPLAICAAFGITWLVDEIRFRRYRQILISVAVLVALSWLNAPSWLNLNMDELKKWYHVNLGLRYGATPAGLDRGVELLGEVAQEFPRDPDARSHHGVVLRRAGRYASALEEFEAAAALRPGDAVIPFQMGKTYAEMGADSLAVLAFTRALSIAPLYEDAYEHLAFTYSRQGRYAEAAGEFEKAVRINPTDSSLRLNLGVTYGMLGRTQDAIGELEQALRLDRANWKARYNLAVALASVGRADEARSQLEMIVEAEPGNEAAREALRDLGGQEGF